MACVRYRRGRHLKIVKQEDTMPDTEIIREAVRNPHNSEKLAYALTEIVHFINEIYVRLGDLEDEIEELK